MDMNILGCEISHGMERKRRCPSRNSMDQSVILMEYHIQWEGNAVEPPRIPGERRRQEPKITN